MYTSRIHNFPRIRRVAWLRFLGLYFFLSCRCCGESTGMSTYSQEECFWKDYHNNSGKQWLGSERPLSWSRCARRKVDLRNSENTRTRACMAGPRHHRNQSGKERSREGGNKPRSLSPTISTAKLSGLPMQPGTVGLCM